MGHADPEPRAVAFTLLKGGVTKTTLFVNTAAALTDRGHDVVVVDLDTNGNATFYLGQEQHYHDPAVTLGDVILGDGTATPGDLVVDTGLGFDLVPASAELERLPGDITREPTPSETLQYGLVEPVIGDRYDYVLIDTPADRGLLLNNACVASLNLMIPVIPEEGVVNGLHNIIDRVVEPLQKRRDLEILAIVPNRLSQRIDHRNEDRMLLEALCRNETFADYVPDFAYLAPETWDAIDAGDVSPLPKPGIREDADINKAFRAHETLATYNPDNEQLAYFDELASIIETGGVSRDD